MIQLRRIVQGKNEECRMKNQPASCGNKLLAFRTGRFTIHHSSFIIPMRSLFAIIHEDADLLVVHKPADLVCHPTKGDEFSSLISRARIYLRAAGCLPSAAPHLIHRLDRETSGIVVIAKNPAAAGELGKVWETRV